MTEQSPATTSLFPRYLGYFVVFVFAVFCLLVSVFFFAFIFAPTPSPYNVTVTTYTPPTPSDVSIAVLELNGVIGDTQPATITPDQLRTLLGYIETSQYDGILLSINSPGGGVTASDTIYHQLVQFKQESQIPVWSQFQSIAASGGYYIAMSSDKIYAHPTGITGSIGVISSFPYYYQLMDKVGVGVETIKSPSVTRETSFKDMGSGSRPMDPEEREILQHIIDQMWVGFIHVVEQGRDGILDREEIERLADGRVFTAQDALALGLVDNIGYLDESLLAFANELGDPQANVDIIALSPSFSELFSLELGNTNISLELPELRPRETFEYRWEFAPTVP